MSLLPSPPPPRHATPPPPVLPPKTHNQVGSPRNSLLLRLLCVELALVERELVTLEDVPVGAAALARPGRDAREEAVALELVLEGLSKRLRGGALLALALCVRGESLLASSLGSVGARLGEVEAVVLVVPVAERGGVDGHDRVLGEGVRPDELVVGRVVDDIENARLAADDLGSPGVGAVVKAKGAELHVATHAADGLDGLVRRELGHGGGAREVELWYE